MTTINVTTASTKELLSFFNAHTGGNQLVKFQNRTSAEARVNALIAEMEAEAQGDQKAAIAACRRGEDAIPSSDPYAFTSTPEFAKAEKLNVKVDHTARNKCVDKVLAETGATEAEHVAHRVETIKPYILAKQVVAQCITNGMTTRKEILAACIARGIKLNTADGAHYEMCVRKA